MVNISTLDYVKDSSLSYIKNIIWYTANHEVLLPPLIRQPITKSYYHRLFDSQSSYRFTWTNRNLYLFSTNHLTVGPIETLYIFSTNYLAASLGTNRNSIPIFDQSYYSINWTNRNGLVFLSVHSYLQTSYISVVKKVSFTATRAKTQ